MPSHALHSLLRRAAAGVLLSALAACGGGGGDLADEGPPIDLDGPTFGVSGTMSGLERSIELVLEAWPEGNRDPGLVITEALTVRDGSFRFESRVPQGWNANVSPQDLWRQPYQGCVLTRGGGSMPPSHDANLGPVTADVSDLDFRCGRGYAIGGTVTGDLGPAPANGQPALSVSALPPPGGNPLPVFQVASVDAVGPFSMDANRGGAPNGVPLLPGTPYRVTTYSPNMQACSVTNGTGIMPARDVDDVLVDCQEGVEVRFTVTGLKGSGLRVQMRRESAGPDPLGLEPPPTSPQDVSSNGEHTLYFKVHPGDLYFFSVYRQPASPPQECTVVNGTGTVPDHPITDIEIRCPAPEKTWRYDDAATFFTDKPLGGGTAGWGVVDDRFQAPRAPHPGGGQTSLVDTALYQNLFVHPGTDMAVYSSDDGTDYRIATEGARGPEPRISSIRTRWWLRKNSPNTDVRFMLSHLYLDTWVDNAGLPWAMRELNARAWIELRAYEVSDVDGSVSQVPMHAAIGHVDIVARRTDDDRVKWSTSVGSDASATVPVFAPDSAVFDMSQASADFGGAAFMKLKEPIPLVVDLSGLKVRSRVMVEMTAAVQALSGYTFESHAVAYLRDPATFASEETGGGVELVAMEGVSITEPGSLPADFAPQPSAAPAPACASPTAPRATLQFAAPVFTVSEGDPTNRSITVTRSGNTAGALSARVTVQPGTATPGLDYRAGDVVVRFADGDVTPRTFVLPVLQDTLAEGSETVLLTLDSVSGCADPGALSSATVMLADDEDPPPQPPPGGTLDAGFGASGKVATYGIGGAPAAMALQPDGRIVMAGGSTTDFVLARFLANGQLDTSFGTGGVVTTDIAGGFQQEQAHAVLVQPDGRIVVAGTSQPAGGGQPMVVALARYMANGALDTSFGSGGKVFDTAQPGTAYAIALQGDGKLVIAGSAPVSGRGDDFADLLLARYDSNGQLDPGFGVGGRVVTDVVGESERARNVLLLPDGRIVASGMETGLINTQPTLVMQVLPDGQPDPAFGTQGKLRLAGPLIGWALARQADGKLLLGGSTEFGPAARAAVLRLNANGSIDTSFGSAGLAVQAFSGETDIAKSVVVQPDGRILVAGRTGGTNRNTGVTRLLASGALDTSFGPGGLLVIDFDAFPDEAERALLQPDGKLLLGGWARDRSNVIGYALVRLQP